MHQKKKLSPLTISAASVFASFVCIATIVISIRVLATEGYFNIGESVVYLSALLFGPAVGAFAGGVGSMIADLILGYPHYAPATLIIKAIEGYVVGIIRRNNPKFRSLLYWKVFTLLLGIVAGALLAVIGTICYSGEAELTLGFTEFKLFVPSEFWIVLGIMVASSIAIVGFVTEPEFGWAVFSVISGGFTMVLGYFVYEMYIIGWLFNVQAWALAEVPINIGQMIIGATVALPAAKILQRAFPEIKRS